MPTVVWQSSPDHHVELSSREVQIPLNVKVYTLNHKLNTLIEMPQACRARQNQRSGITEQNATYAFGLVIVRVISTVKERGKNASLLWCRRVRLVWDPGRWANLSDRECVRKEVGLLWATLHKAVAVNAWRAE